MALAGCRYWVGLAGAALLACAGESRPVELRVGLDPDASDFGAVEVWGLPPSLRKALARVEPQDRRWSEGLAVQAASPEGPTPPLAGKYSIAPSGCLRFAPSYRPEGPLTYRIKLDPAALARLAGRKPTTDSARSWTFMLPGLSTPRPSTVVTAVHPSAAVVPANQLRWYLEFSAPMREGEAEGRVHLIDSRGREIRGAFLTVREELWDRDRRRLTLLFDMGRVKQGIRTRVEAGPVLRPGERYSIRIDGDWPDARGASLARDTVRRFRAGPEDHAAVQPGSWRLHPPGIGSRRALVVEFGEPLDHALAARLLAVTGPDGQVVEGEATLTANDREWRFIPGSPWLAGQYRLQISPALEDLAGNRVGHVFDADLARGQRAGVDSAAVFLEFTPLGELSLR